MKYLRDPSTASQKHTRFTGAVLPNMLTAPKVTFFPFYTHLHFFYETHLIFRRFSSVVHSEFTNELVRREISNEITTAIRLPIKVNAGSPPFVLRLIERQKYARVSHCTINSRNAQTAPVSLFSVHYTRTSPSARNGFTRLALNKIKL